MMSRLISIFKKDAPEEEVVHTVSTCETRPLELENVTLPKTEPTFTITQNTVERVKKLVERDGRKNAFLRFSVVSGGCSGYSYDFKVDNNVNDDDVVIESDGVKVVTDAMSIQLIGGSVLDYIDDASGSKFEVKNPNASHGCGCGSSFGI